MDQIKEREQRSSTARDAADTRAAKLTGQAREWEKFQHSRSGNTGGFFATRFNCGCRSSLSRDVVIAWSVLPSPERPA
jgi:hypothetical protein